MDFFRRRGASTTATEPRAAELRTFEPVARSAFRVLGIAAGASQREVFDAASRVRLALKVGVRKTFDSDLAWLGLVAREESDVRDAVGRLSEPAQRAFERLFWFDEPPLVKGVKTVEELRRAISSMRSGERVETREEFALLHDEALLLLAGLTRLDSQLLETEAWAHAFDLWRRVFESDEFRSRLVAADLRGDFEQLVTYSEVRDLRERAPRIVSQPLAERARSAALRGDAGECGRVLSLLRAAKLPRTLLEEYEREALGPLEDSLTEKIDTAFGWLYLITIESRAAATVRNYANAAWRKFRALVPELSEFTRAAGASHYASRRILEHAASKLLLLSQRFEESGRREESLFVALKAYALAPPATEAHEKASARLRAFDVSEVFQTKTVEGYADALAREFSDERDNKKLFRDDPRGERTLDSFFKSVGTPPQKKASLWPLLLTFLGFACTCSSLQFCGGINTRVPSRYPGLFPAPTYTPLQMNLNYNLNLNIRPYPIPTPLILEDLDKPSRVRKRRPRTRNSNTRVENGNSIRVHNDNALKWPPPAP